MNIVLKRRIKLIRAMIEAKKSLPGFGLKSAIDAIISLIRQDKDGYFLSISSDDPTKVSFSKKNSSNSEKSSEKNRTRSSLQRFIRRQMNIDNDFISDVSLDKFVIMVSLLVDESLDSKIKIIDGEDIVKYYTNTQIRSCMTGSCASFKTSIYSLNKNKVKMVIFNNDVRALLWQCDDGKIVLDRAYPSGHWGVSFIRTWAKKRGYLLRDVPDSVTGTGNNGISDGNCHIVTLMHDGIFPYMDTFKFALISKTQIIVSNDPTFGNAILTNTDGGFYQKQVCQQCGAFVENGHERFVSNGSTDNILYCGTCYDRLAFSCSICGKYTLNRFRYRNWNMCNMCHGLAKAFTTHNKCNCYNCQDRRNLYVSVIEREVVQENRAKNTQLSFDFDD